MEFNSFGEYEKSGYCSDAVNALLCFFDVDPDDGFGSLPGEVDWKPSFRVYKDEGLVHVEISRAYLYHCAVVCTDEEAKEAMMEIICAKAPINRFIICDALDAAQRIDDIDKAVLLGGFIIYNAS